MKNTCCFNGFHGLLRLHPSLVVKPGRLISPIMLVVVLASISACVDGGVMQEGSGHQGRSEAITDFQGIRAFHWGSGMEQKQVALKLPVKFQSPTTCTLLIARSHIQTEGQLGLENIYLFENEGNDFWMSSSSSAPYRGSVAGRSIPILTETFTIYGRREGLTSYTETFSGAFTLTLFARLLDAIDSGGYLPGHGLAVSMECDQPFNIEGVQYGNNLHLVDEEMLRDGTFFASPFVGSTVHEGAYSANLDGAFSGAWYGQGVTSNGFQTGEVELSHPQGTTSWPLGIITEFNEVQAGPGEYKIRVNRTGNNWAFWWVVLHDLSTPTADELSILDKSAIQSY